MRGCRWNAIKERLPHVSQLLFSSSRLPKFLSYDVTQASCDFHQEMFCLKLFFYQCLEPRVGWGWWLSKILKITNEKLQPHLPSFQLWEQCRIRVLTRNSSFIFRGRGGSFWFCPRLWVFPNFYSYRHTKSHGNKWHGCFYSCFQLYKPSKCFPFPLEKNKWNILFPQFWKNVFQPIRISVSYHWASSHGHPFFGANPYIFSKMNGEYGPYMVQTMPRVWL